MRSSDKRDVPGLIQRTSALLRESLGVHPVIVWQQHGTPDAAIEYYQFVPRGELQFPALPMHMFGVFLDGRTVQYDDGGTQNSVQEQGMHTTFPNHCAAVPKGMPSAWKAASGSLTLAMVYLPERGQVLLEKMTIGALHPVLLRDELLVSLTRQLKSASMAQQPLSREYEKCLIEAFLGQLDWLVSSNQTPQPKHRSTLSDVVISNALSLIDHHLNDTLTIGSLCGELQITPTIFRSRFRAATGLPVHRYILLRRLTVAREFVETSKMPLQIVASYCGFSSQSHMTSLFKRHLGVTPSDLRRGACASLPSR